MRVQVVLAITSFFVFKKKVKSYEIIFVINGEIGFSGKIISKVNDDIVT